MKESNTPKVFKCSELGVIPVDWDLINLVSGAEILTGFPFESKNFLPYGLKLLRGANIKRGCIDWNDETTRYWGKLTPELTPYILKPGDIVISMDGSLVGKSFARLSESDMPALLVQRVARVRSNTIDMGYLKEFICSDWFTKHCDSVKTASAIPHISPKDIRKFKIPLPPTIKEQKAIAEALSNTNELIESLEQLIDKKRLIKKGAMQELLTGKRRLPGFIKSNTFKKTEIGLIPEDWEYLEMSTIGHTIIGLTYKPTDVSSYGTLVLRSSNVQNGKISFENNVFVDMHLPERVIVHNGDILICVRNGSRNLIGKCALINESVEGCAFGAFMSVYRSKYSNFIFYQFQSNLIQNQINEVMGATINQLTNKDLAGFKLMMPTNPEEQKAIAKVLTDMDSEIEALERKLNKYRHIKQGMMEKLLTGKIRLV